MVQSQGQESPASAGSGIVPEKERDGITLQINGESFHHTGDPAMPLLWYLREVLQLTGTKYADAHGIGGADLVLVDGKTSHSR